MSTWSLVPPRPRPAMEPTLVLLRPRGWAAAPVAFRTRLRTQAVTWRTRPRIPPGATIIKTIRAAPKITGDSCRFAPVRSIQTGMKTTRNAPIAGPKIVAAPPTTTATSNVIDRFTPNCSLLTNEVCNENSAPAIPGEHRAHAEDDDLVGRRVDAERRGRGLVVADRDDRSAGPAADQIANEHERDDGKGEEDVIAPLIVRQAGPSPVLGSAPSRARSCPASHRSDR